MSSATLLLPDFLLIALGFAVCRWTSLGRPVWDAAERLGYHLLFPVLLFTSVLKSPLQPAQTAALAFTGVSTVVCGIALALSIGRWPGVDARLHASGAQTAFRFNTFIALALAERLAGAPGLAWMALLVALCVPIANVAAVWPLARQGGHAYGRELLRNPLIVATVGGLVANVLDLKLPGPVATTLQRIGGAALPVGLMAVGAGLRFGAVRSAPRLAAAFLAIRHVALPAFACALTAVLGLAAPQRLVVVLFAALPTASSAYVLAARMGGDGAFVSGLITLSTLLAMVGIPLWLAAV